MEYIEIIGKINNGLIKIVKKLKRDDLNLDEDDLMQELYLYLWNEWKNGKLTNKNSSYILRGCYLYLKNFIRKEKNLNKISIEEFYGNGIDVNEKKYEIDTIFEFLNEKEKSILKLILEGYTLREIGQKFGISHVMVLKIIKKIRKKTEKYKELLF